MKEVDARGLSCPEPVMLTNDAVKSGEKVKVLVDEACARTNVEKFLKSKGKNFTTTQDGNSWIIEEN